MTPSATWIIPFCFPNFWTVVIHPCEHSLASFTLENFDRLINHFTTAFHSRDTSELFSRKARVIRGVNQFDLFCCTVCLSMPGHSHQLLFVTVRWRSKASDSRDQQKVPTSFATLRQSLDMDILSRISASSSFHGRLSAALRDPFTTFSRRITMPIMGRHLKQADGPFSVVSSSATVPGTSAAYMDWLCDGSYYACDVPRTFCTSAAGQSVAVT